MTGAIGPAKLAALYPSHGVFVSRWGTSATVDVLRGFLRPADAAELIKAAAASGVS